MQNLDQDSHAVFLPAFADLEISPPVAAFLKRGCRAILAGETRDEYVARKMSEARVASETAVHFQSFAAEALRCSGAPILIAVDQELAGIQRLHDLVPPWPPASALGAAGADEIEAAAEAVGKAAKTLGVNLFLAPIVDVVSGQNPWLSGRTMGKDAYDVARIGAAFVRGVQRAGVVTTAKHFPGHHDITGDPAVDASAKVTGGVEALAPGYEPFRAVIAAGTRAIMVGPAPVPSLDPDEAASTSGPVIALLRDHFGFDGLIVSDDLDGAAVLRGANLAEKVVQSLVAGADLLLVAAGDHLPDLSAAVRAAVTDGKLPESRLRDAADRVRATVAWAHG